MIRFECPGCQAIYTVKDDKAGKTGKCPSCGSQFVIPQPESELEPPASLPPVPEVALAIPIPPPSITPIKRADRPLRRVEADSDEFDDVDRPRRRRRTRPQDDDPSWIQTNKGLFRVISGVMSLITGAFQLMCGVGILAAGTFLFAAVAGFSGTPGNGQGFSNLWSGLLLMCGLVSLVFALLYMLAGIGALTRNRYGRILTILVGMVATVWSMIAFGRAGMSLLNLELLPFFFGVLQLLFAATHALTSFFAAIGAGSDREFNQ